MSKTNQEKGFKSQEHTLPYLPVGSTSTNSESSDSKSITPFIPCKILKKLCFSADTGKLLTLSCSPMIYGEKWFGTQSRLIEENLGTMLFVKKFYIICYFY